MKHTLGLTAVALLIVFAPNLMFLHEGALGASGSDALKHVWSQWFVVNQLWSGQGLALQTDLIHHPVGGAFFSLDFINALLGLPLRLFLDPVPTYNLVLMLNLGLAALCGTRLAHLFVDDPWAAGVGGVGFAFSAWVLAFPVGSGVSETAVFWPMPLILLLACRTWTHAGWRTPLAAGALLSLQGAACWSHGITAGLLLVGLFCSTLFHDRNEWKQDGRPQRLAALLGAALLIAIPAYLAVSGTVSADDAIKTRNLSLFHSAPIGPLDAMETNNMALMDFIALGSWGLRRASVGTEQLMYAANPGLILLGLAIMAWVRRLPHGRLLAVGAVFMILLTLGPRIYFDHARSIGGIPNPIYLFAYWCIPLVNATIHSVDRFAVGTQLCIALMAALTVQQLNPRWRVIAFAAVMVELVAISPGPWPVPMVEAQVHPASLQIQASDADGAVLDVPFLEGDQTHRWFLGDVFLQQTVHGKPIPFQLEGQDLETVSPQTRSNPFFKKLAASAIDGRPLASGCTGVDELSQLGFDWVVWRPGLTPDARRKEFGAVLGSCLSNPKDLGDRILYRITP
jgi:hypothetical protein